MTRRAQIPTATSTWRGQAITHRTDRVIVKVAPNERGSGPDRLQAPAATMAALVPGARVHRVSADTGTVVLEVPEGTDVVALADELTQRPDVLEAAPDRVTSVTLTPTDTRYSEQWAFPKIAADSAWDAETGTAGVLIAVLDTGISIQNGALTHPDLDDSTRYLLGTDFVSDDTVPEMVQVPLEGS